MSASKQGLSAVESTFLSLIIYAGASQFVALALLGSATPLLLSVLTLLAMNARHAFYGPALLERLESPPDRLRYAPLWSFGLTDEVFATTVARARGLPWSERWMSGLGLAAYLSWVGGTLVGSVLGAGAFAAYPIVDRALGFMLPALFLSLLAAMLSRRQAVTAISAALVCLVVAALTSVTTGILVGMISGALLATMRREEAAGGRGSSPTQEAASVE